MQGPSTNLILEVEQHDLFFDKRVHVGESLDSLAMMGVTKRRDGSTLCSVCIVYV